MRAWWVEDPGPIDGHPLRLGERRDPVPGPGEVLVEVSVCGVCRTDLHLAEGDLAPHRPHAVPGHEIIGTVVDREQFAYAVPEVFSDMEAAPLLCAGIIGYRALRRAALSPGGRLGIYGFGASAHLAAQVALHEGATVHVLTRSADARRLALELGAASAGDASDEPPEPLDAAIRFAPAGELVPVALHALDRGGTLAVAGIHLSDIPPLRYADHLFDERQLRSITANTRRDGEAFLEIAAASRYGRR